MHSAILSFIDRGSIGHKRDRCGKTACPDAGLIDADRLELMGYNGTGVEITEAEARAIGRFLETEVLPALLPGTRLTYDLSVTDAPDDHTFHRDDFAKNYSASYEWLTRFAQFCGTCSGFRVL